MAGGIMAEIRERLSSGESAKALIDAGFKQGSVYKAQWQLRKEGKLKGGKAEGKGTDGASQAAVASMAPAPMAHDGGSPAQDQTPEHTHDDLEQVLAELVGEVRELAQRIE